MQNVVVAVCIGAQQRFIQNLRDPRLAEARRDRHIAPLRRLFARRDQSGIIHRRLDAELFEDGLVIIDREGVIRLGERVLLPVHLPGGQDARLERVAQRRSREVQEVSGLGQFLLIGTRMHHQHVRTLSADQAGFEDRVVLRDVAARDLQIDLDIRVFRLKVGDHGLKDVGVLGAPGDEGDLRLPRGGGSGCFFGRGLRGRFRRVLFCRGRAHAPCKQGYDQHGGKQDAQSLFHSSFSFSFS